MRYVGARRIYQRFEWFELAGHRFEEQLRMPLHSQNETTTRHRDCLDHPVARNTLDPYRFRRLRHRLMMQRVHWNGIGFEDLC